MTVVYNDFKFKVNFNSKRKRNTSFDLTSYNKKQNINL
jgi:hypothetical protein